MKMSEKTLLKKIEQAFKENYCNGSYKLEVNKKCDELIRHNRLKAFWFSYIAR